jgi:nanoRNase/pAp phosphatase (c-di-AMP/oligoRNAs hydrolase)
LTITERRETMDTPIGSTVSNSEKIKRLLDVVHPDDALAVLISADPDAIASALALKRIFWRRARRIGLFRINKIERADNQALVRMLSIDLRHIGRLKKSDFTKWALVDSQPHHSEHFGGRSYNIIIDHHPPGDNLRADYIEVREDYGATATILTEYLKAAGIRPSPRLATALFYGIKSDTNNFVRKTIANDINAFRHLYEYANLNIVKKIEASEITKKNLADIRKAMQRLEFFKHTALVHMGRVKNADTLVIVADFLLKLAEATWSVVSGLQGDRLIVIFRNAGFRRNAGKLARELFGDIGSAGGHKSAARAEIAVENLQPAPRRDSDYRDFLLGRIKRSPDKR